MTFAIHLNSGENVDGKIFWPRCEIKRKYLIIPTIPLRDNCIETEFGRFMYEQSNTLRGT